MLTLSVAIVIASTYVTFLAYERARTQTSVLRILSTGLGGSVLGVGVGLAHYVSMLAFRLTVPFHHDPRWICLAALIGAAGATAANLTLGVAGKYPLGRWLASGALMGSSITAMHYVGMASMRFDGHIHYDPLIVIGSLGLAICGSTLALLYGTTRDAPFQANQHVWSLAGAVVLGLSTMAMHFTGLAAARFEIHRNSSLEQLALSPLSPEAQFISTVAAAGLVLILLGSLIHQRNNANILSILESTTDAYMALDRDWRILYVNPMAQKALGPGVVGKNLWTEVFPTAVGSSFEKAYRQALETGRPVSTVDYAPWVEGWYEAHAYPSPHGLSLFFRDVTEARHSQMLLRERELAQERETARNRFIQIAAHELRNPMTGIKGVLGLIRRRIELGRPPGDILSLMHNVEHEVDRLSSLLSEVLEAFRVNEGQLNLAREALNLAELLRGAVSFYAYFAHQHQFHLDTPPTPVWVVGDRKRLEDVFRNLLSNAVKYSPANSAIQITLTVGDNTARVAVRDQGLGIPNDQLEQIFEGFVRGTNLTPGHAGGMGLGLFICADVVRRHGGRIWAENNPDVGATLWVELPVQQSVGGDPGADSDRGG